MAWRHACFLPAPRLPAMPFTAFLSLKSFLCYALYGAGVTRLLSLTALKTRCVRRVAYMLLCMRAALRAAWRARTFVRHGHFTARVLPGFTYCARTHARFMRAPPPPDARAARHARTPAGGAYARRRKNRRFAAHLHAPLALLALHARMVSFVFVYYSSPPPLGSVLPFQLLARAREGQKVVVSTRAWRAYLRTGESFSLSYHVVPRHGLTRTYSGFRILYWRQTPAYFRWNVSSPRDACVLDNMRIWRARHSTVYMLVGPPSAFGAGSNTRALWHGGCFYSSALVRAAYSAARCCAFKRRTCVTYQRVPAAIARARQRARFRAARACSPPYGVRMPSSLRIKRQRSSLHY